VKRHRAFALVALVALLSLAGACSNGDGSGDGGGARRAPDRSTNDTAASFPASALPEARTEVAGALWNRHLAVAGGFTADGRPTARLDLLGEDGRWVRGPDLPSPRDHASLATLGDRLYLVGGNAPDGPTDEVWSLGPGAREWRREPSLRSPRAALATVSDGEALWAVGGVDGRGVLDTVERFEPSGSGWSDGPAMRVPREHTAATVVGETVYAIGGRQLSLESNLTSVESLGVPDGAWQPVPDLLHSRGGIAAASVGGMPCVAGGEEPEGTIGTVECLVDDQWVAVATLATPRHGLAVVAVGDRLHVLGGGPEPGLTVSGAHEIIDVTR
jgi:hypothetical protein